MTEQPETGAEVQALGTARPGAGNVADDLLWRQLKSVPAFRALLRAVEARFYRAYALDGPVLDVGCGDGHFAAMTFAERLDVGVDPWWGPLRKSRRAGVYGSVIQGLGDRLPFPDGAFQSAISNSVLEHIPDVQPVLDDVGRVLAPGGLLLLTMPSHRFTDWLGGAALCERVGLEGAADAYRRFFNRVSRHAHTDPPDVWAGRLARAGFAIERWQYYFSPGALRALEWGHLQGLPAALSHALTGHWILGPYESSLRPTERWLRPYFEEPFGDEGAYLFFAARKRADGPIATMLPPARPFTRAELEDGARPAPPAEVSAAQPATVPLPIEDAAAPATQREARRARSGPPRWLAALLAALALSLAGLGQSAWRAAPEAAGTGAWLLGLALLAMGGAGWLARRSGAAAYQEREEPAAGARRGWWLLPAFLLALLAPGLASSPVPGAGRPALALGAWLGATGLGLFALAPPASRDWFRAHWRRPARAELLLLVGLFYFAITVRAFDLTNLPFILNGTEANIGLEVARVAAGELRDPFATGWLTNPTLPFFMMAPAVAVFGRTVLAVRLLSPLIGALTVVAVYALGRRLFGRLVALPAAVLLAGAHTHLHYSRLGMTNIWDPLVIWLAIGLIALAIRRGDRRAWLLAGLATGAAAYFFSGVHLLPLMLPLGFVVWGAAQPEAFRAQARHVVAGAAIALLVALPAVRYYQTHPGVFLDRANALGIFQSGWLAREAAATGVNQWALLAGQFQAAFLGLGAVADTSLAYNAGIPLLTYFPALFATLGAGIAAWRWRRAREAWLLAWLLVTFVFGGALLLTPPASHRLLPALPAACLLAGIALAWFGRRIGGALGLDRRRQLILLTALAVAMAVGDAAFYFGRYRAEHRFGDRNSEIAARVAEFLNGVEDAGWPAYFHGAPSMFADFPTIRYLSPRYVPGLNLTDVVEPTVPQPPTGAPGAIFILVPERSLEIEALQSAFPGGSLQVVPGVFANPLFYVYKVELSR